MTTLKSYLSIALIGLLSISILSCKSKKMAVKSNADVEVVEDKPVVEKEPEAAPPAKRQEPPAPVEEKPNYNFSNIQFEFDSEVLKTASYGELDKVAREMKKDLNAKFTINGHSSQEGSPEHNMALSVDRANSVKLYLVNAGINSNNLSSKGYGATKPVSKNDTEDGRALNRRVEIKLAN